MRILVIEDEPKTGDYLVRGLGESGFTVSLARNGRDGLQMAGEEHPDLIVLDVMLPVMDGWQVLRALRLQDGGADVPVIFLTARSDEIDRIVGLEIGADDYVTKPFSPRELVARIRVILRRARAATMPPRPPADAGKPIVAGASRFELRALEARVLFHGQPLDLTRYEYLLLKTLLESPGHVLSRTQLMERVWSGASDTLERTVDAHVKSLRAKLRAIDAQEEPIQTHRGLGYSLAGA